MALIGAVGLLSAAVASPGAADTLKELEKLEVVDRAYRMGADLGSRYVGEHTERLASIVLLKECGRTDLAAILECGLPNSLDHFLAAPQASDPPLAQRIYAAQMTRASLAGITAAITTALRTDIDDDRKEEEQALSENAAALLPR